jgi:pSer/pThr/pTyr-binding forkhead associated (FHA) protein
LTPALVFKEGPLAGRRIDVVEELVIGRVDAGLTIDDEEVSRRHAVVRPGDDAIEIEDLGSRNGTYVNGVRIDTVTRLAGGDSVRLGTSVLQVEAPRAVAETVAAAVPAAPVAPPPPPPAAPPAPPAAAPAPAVGRSAPAAAFGAYSAPAAGKRKRGVASRQLGPQLVSFAVVAATAVALVLYFADH